eukprot:6204029-Pleurochrysis_carterae.AAC.2
MSPIEPGNRAVSSPVPLMEPVGAPTARVVVESVRKGGGRRATREQRRLRPHVYGGVTKSCVGRIIESIDDSGMHAWKDQSAAIFAISANQA